MSVRCHDLDVSRALLIIVGSYGVSPSLSCCDELSFSFCDFVVIGLNTLLDLGTLDVCLAMGYPWRQWDVLLIPLMYVLALNSPIPEVKLG